MLFDGDGNQLEFLDVLSLASTIVWFKSIMEGEKRDKHIDEDIEILRTHLFQVEDKVDRILEILENKV